MFREHYFVRCMARTRKKLLDAIEQLNECSRDLTDVLKRFERATSQLAGRVDKGEFIVDALRGVSGSMRRRELLEALESFEFARHRVRVGMFAVAIEEGTSLSEMSRALGVSRQLASRLGGEVENF
jgi:hypothetical protein